MKRPNILMIMADQIRLKTLQGMGDEIPTPNLNRLMDKSLVFTQAVCSCPLCTPSRASLATGKYPSRCGVPIHDAVLSYEETTYYQLLRKSGYRVGMAGKSDLHKKDKHCGIHGDTPQMYHYGFTDPFETEGKMNSAWFSVDSNGKKKLAGPYQHYLETHAPGGLEALNADYKQYLRKDPRYRATPSVLEGEHFLDHFIGRAACDWLEHVQDEEPWHYFVSFTGPHNPWDPPKEEFEKYKDTRFPAPIADNLENKPEWIKKRAAEQTGGMTEELMQNMKRCYAGSVNVVDHWVGQLLDVLERRGLAENTVVIFCADHGELLGDHGLVEKSAMYETSVRIPLVIHTPGMTRRVDTPAMAQLMDLAPTCLELAGVRYNDQDMDAVSLMPLLENPERTDWNPHTLQISELSNCQMVYDGRYKWIRNWNDLYELYDLQQDPQELHNLIHECPEIAARMAALTYRH